MDEIAVVGFEDLVRGGDVDVEGKSLGGVDGLGCLQQRLR